MLGRAVDHAGQRSWVAQDKCHPLAYAKPEAQGDRKAAMEEPALPSFGNRIELISAGRVRCGGILHRGDRRSHSPPPESYVIPPRLA